jgi:hypothetical protein
MKRTWFIYSQFYYPYWDSETEHLAWIDSNRKRLELPPDCISTEEEAEKLLKQSGLKELGPEFMDCLFVNTNAS